MSHSAPNKQRPRDFTKFDAAIIYANDCILDPAIQKRRVSDSRVGIAIDGFGREISLRSDHA